jgi:hypothetical protein
LFVSGLLGRVSGSVVVSSFLLTTISGTSGIFVLDFANGIAQMTVHRVMGGLYLPWQSALDAAVADLFCPVDDSKVLL